MITTSSYPWMTREYQHDQEVEEAKAEILNARMKNSPLDPETKPRTIDMRSLPERGD